LVRARSHRVEFAYRRCSRGRTYTGRAPKPAPRRDNACTARARTRSSGRSGYGPCLRKALPRSSGRAHHPNAVISYKIPIGTVFFLFSSKGERKNLKGSLRYLIVEATTTIEVLEKRGIGLTAPKVHIGDLKVAPNYL
jgi:hypothetical protein